MSARLLWISAMQALYDSPCGLLPLLDREVDGEHGSDAFCDEPRSTHAGRPIRREEQGWPSDFSRAVVTVGRLSRSPRSFTSRPWLESWTLVASGFAREEISLDSGLSGGPGDLWLADIYDKVVKILGGWYDEALLDPAGCAAGFAVMQRRHDSDVLPLQFNDDHRFWWFQARFRWLVLSAGTVVVECQPCGTV
jgi:hypothetical protein